LRRCASTTCPRRHPGPAGRAAGARRRGRLGPAEPRAWRDQPAGCQRARRATGGHRTGRAGLVDALHRARRHCMVQQHRAHPGQEHLAGHLRPGLGDAGGAAHEAARTVMV